MDTDKCIPANPDISGIGVRTAIYLQNLLCFLPVILYLSDGKISGDELAGIQDQSTGMLAIAFAILITTVSLAAGRNPTVSNFHAAIILDLSWMNNTSTWIWFILYVHERSRTTYNHVPATWPAWRSNLWSTVRAGFGTGPTSQGEEVDEREQTKLQKVVKHLGNSLTIQWVQRFAQLILAAPVLTLGSIHLSMMAAIGIWLWHDTAGFGKPIDCCTPMLTVFGASVSINSTPLQIFSLVMYAVVLIPGLNLLPPFAFFLFFHISYNHFCKRIHTVLHGRARTEVGETDPSPADIGVHTAFLYVGLSCLVAINLLFIVDIELTLRRNMHNQSNEERDWGFGQILALLLLLVPLRDTWIALRNIQKSSEQRLEQAFLAVAKADLPQLVQDAAGAKKQIPRFGNFLQLAAYYGSKELIELFLKEHLVDVNTVGGDYGTALQAAAARGHKDLVADLLGSGADVNLVGGDYGTALCAACANGHVDVVNALLRDPAIERNTESEFGSPLHIAILLDKRTIAKVLVENGPEAAECKWRDTELKAVDIESGMRMREISGTLTGNGLTKLVSGLSFYAMCADELPIPSPSSQ